MTHPRTARRVGLLATGAAVAVAAGVAAYVRRQYVAITVEGMSMSPALYPGDKVLVRRGIRGIRPGRIVVLARPRSGEGWRRLAPAGRDLDATSWYIKRVVAVSGQPYPEVMKREGVVPSGHVVVIGDHPHSEDSKQHGPCPVDQILGVQVRKLSMTDPAAAAVPDLGAVVFDDDAVVLSEDDIRAADPTRREGA
ncbi:signal peptidase I/APA family basic amino acid/polyamine antiporter [Stackebrandtia albiflava]|uniref:Signal peptidase I/APA family basic amino acid/polyamine antiporter n=1 Tax=Stackebrandtia albiflava TaxID=406432 RepID=A0A562UQV7_9ACTN|nr:S24/S26 family peptidase [Stackebrandtia albiflava]TWJ07986.1 signal peptidase I/APA family basic amino acid/polyamine antiporter [Stackebrandtia albiflava]